LTAGDESPPSSPPITVVFLIILLRFILNKGFDYLLHIANLDENVLRLEIGMDNAAVSV
jgi:hypothetical protein